MNICMITGEFPPFCAGIGNYVYNLSKFLKMKGHNITILTRGSYSKGIVRTTFDDLDVWKVRYLPLYPFHARIHGHYLDGIISKYEDCFDIIHVHSPLAAFPKTTKPTIVTEHGTVKGGIYNSSNTDLSTLFLKLFLREFLSLERDLLEKSDVITTVSKSCMHEIKASVGQEEKIFVLGNGVNTGYFKPNDTIDRAQNIVLYTGRLDSRKGVVDLITSAKYVVKNYPETRFIVTGKGPNEGYIRRQISKLNLKGNVTLTGFVSRDELLRLYQSCTMYVLPSYYEGLPTTLLEAMACGLPSIATDVDGSSEVISHGKTGMLVPPKCPEALSASIQEFLADERKRKEIGHCGKNYVKETYDWSKIADKTAEIYASLNQ